MPIVERQVKQQPLEQPVEPSFSAEQWLHKAAMKAEQSDYVAAIDCYTRAIDLDPDCARAYGNRGLLKGNLGQHQGALADLRQAAQLFLSQGKMANYEMVMGYMRNLN